MSDFTKKELEDIFWLIDDYQSSYGEFGETNLINKLQSLIDNYCEHKKDVWPLYTLTGDIPVAGFCYKCNKPVDLEFV